MKKLIYTFSLLFICFSFSSVEALEKCTTTELKRLKEIANNVEFQYEYEIEEVKFTDSDESFYDEVYYTITALNLSDEIKVKVISDEDLEFSLQNNKIDKFLNGQNVKIEITAYTKNLCAGKTLLTKTIKLPYFNIYSKRDECKDNVDFKYCQEFGEFYITDLEFEEELEKYLKNKDSAGDNNIIDSNNFLEFWYVYVVIAIILIVIGVVVFKVIQKKKKKDSDLE